MSTYSGIASLYANPHAPSTSYEEAKFKSVSGLGSSSALLINSEERKESATGLYYICVLGHLTSTYTLQVDEVKAHS